MFVLLFCHSYLCSVKVGQTFVLQPKDTSGNNYPFWENNDYRRTGIRSEFITQTPLFLLLLLIRHQPLFVSLLLFLSLFYSAAICKNDQRGLDRNGDNMPQTCGGRLNISRFSPPAGLASSFFLQVFVTHSRLSLSRFLVTAPRPSVQRTRGRTLTLVHPKSISWDIFAVRAN